MVDRVLYAYKDLELEVITSDDSVIMNGEKLTMVALSREATKFFRDRLIEIFDMAGEINEVYLYYPEQILEVDYYSSLTTKDINAEYAERLISLVSSIVDCWEEADGQ